MCFEISEIQNEYTDFFLNIMDHSSGDAYSYGLKLDHNKCSGQILRMESTWGQNISVNLVGQDLAGNYDVLTDITDMFVQFIQK